MKNKLGIAGRLATIFVHNQKLGLLLVILLFFSGVLLFLLTPKQYNPEITAPAFSIITEMPGASSEEVEQYLTKPIEDKVKDIKGVDEVLSQSIDGGVSVVTVKFYVGEEVEDSKIKLIQKIFGNLDLRPMGASEPLIKEVNPDDVPVLSIALRSEVLDEVSLRQAALSLRDHLKQVDGTTNWDVIGGKMPSYKIEIDPSLLMERGFTVMDLVQAISSSNQRVLIGEVESESKSESLVIDGIFGDIADLQKLPVFTPDGSYAYLGDIANVYLGTEDSEDYVRYRDQLEGEQATVFLSFAKRKGESLSTITNIVLSELDRFKSSDEAQFIDVDVVRNEGITANEEIFGLTINLISSILIVSLVLFFSLGGSASFVVAITIPLTLLTVFSITFLSGQTINRITLFALILSLGLLVDNATVVVENIIRTSRESKTLEDAKTLVIHAVDEVGQGLIMSTLTTLLAFFPMAFVTGMMGPYMGPIPFFVPVALLVSLILAFTINPYLSVNLLGKEKHSEKKKFQLNIPAWSKLKNKIAEIPSHYETILKKIFSSPVLQKKTVYLSLVLLLLVGLLPLLGIVKFRMLPKADRNQFYVYLDMPEAVQIEEMNTVSLLVENFFLKQEYVEGVQSFVGTAPIIDFNGLFKGAESRNAANQATLIVNLTHHDDRRINSEEYVLQLREDLLSQLGNFPELDVQLIEDPPGPPVLSTYLLKVQGENQQNLPAISKDIQMIVSGIKGVVDITSTREDAHYELNYQINYDKLAYYGINFSQVLSTLQAAYEENKISVLHDSALEQHFITLQFEENLTDEATDLSKVFLRSTTGEQVPLNELANIEYQSADPIIYHDERKPTIYVMGEMGDRSVSYAALDTFAALLTYKLPSDEGHVVGISPFGVEYQDIDGSSYQLKFGGEWELTLEVFRDLGLAMLVAIFLIYFVLVGQFHSFSTPLLVMVTIPLSLIGILPGFAILGALNGLYFNATSMIGMIALAGIVVNNAIILVETIHQLRDEEKPLNEVLIEAGSTRLRPILLTSATTILGSLTIVSDPVWAGLAWSIIFGLSVSTVLTLIIFPTLYFIVEEQGIHFLFSKKES